jgi:hypothetical protein
MLFFEVEDCFSCCFVWSISVFHGLSFRAVSHGGVMWLCGRGFRKLYTYRCRVSFFLVDETAVMVGGFPTWVWMVYEPSNRRILGLWLSWTRNSLQAENFLKTLVRLYGSIQYGILMHVKVLDLSITGIMAPYSDREGYEG